MASCWLVLVCCLSAVRGMSLSRADDSFVFKDQELDEGIHRRLISSNFTIQEQECFKEEKFLYEPDKKCYSLLTVGPCACNSDGKRRSSECRDGRGRWLVLDQLPNGRLQAVCRPCPCCDRTLSVYMASDQKCHHRVQERAKLCPVIGTELQHNEFGEGECICVRSPPHLRVQGDGSGVCYQLYRNKPCGPGKILVPFRDLKTLEQVGRCADDPCAKMGEGFAQWERGDGKCHQLGIQGPCQATGTFKVHPITKIPDCIYPSYAILDPKKFPNSPPSANLPTVDRNFALDLLSSRAKRRAGKH